MKTLRIISGGILLLTIATASFAYEFKHANPNQPIKLAVPDSTARVQTYGNAGQVTGYIIQAPNGAVTQYDNSARQQGYVESTGGYQGFQGFTGYQAR